jgi:hypothetical protein
MLSPRLDAAARDEVLKVTRVNEHAPSEANMRKKPLP